MALHDRSFGQDARGREGSADSFGRVELEQVADRTAKRHREFVRARIKVTYDAVRVQQVAE